MLVSEDTSLLNRAKAFDETALSALYDRYEGKIYSYIYHRVGDAHVAEDLTAQVFLRMLEAIQQDAAWRKSFAPWLYRIAHNLVVDHFRRQARQMHVSLEEAYAAPSSSDDPHTSTEQALRGERIRRALNRLTDEQATVVTLRFLEGLSISEVATAIGKSEGAVKALQYRAMNTLRQLLDEEP